MRRLKKKGQTAGYLKVIKGEGKTKIIFKGGFLFNLLKASFLGGLLDSCILSIKDNVARIKAVDLTSSIFLDCSVDAKIRNQGYEYEFGIGNLELLFRFVSMGSENKQTIVPYKNRISVHVENHGQLDYLLTEPDLIQTMVKEEGVIKKLLKACDFKIPITQIIKEDFISYTNTTKVKEIKVVVDIDKEEMLIIGGKESEHKFTLQLGRFIGPKDLTKYSSFSNIYYSDYLIKIMNVLAFDSDDEAGKPPMLYVGVGKPLVIVQRYEGKAIWALAPLEEPETEEVEESEKESDDIPF